MLPISVIRQLTIVLLLCQPIFAQPPTEGQPPQNRRGAESRRPGGPPRFGPLLNREKTKLVEKFDKNGNGWLEQSERSKARKEAQSAPEQSPFGRHGPPGFGRHRDDQSPPKPGERLTPADVRSFPDANLYDLTVLRTLFLEFENEDWETELSDFHGTDVEVPAKLIVDGIEYPNVGIRFRGMSSYMMISPGHKRSFNVSIDLADSNQRLGGYRTINLLNSNGDSSMMSSVLYSKIAREHIPAPKANFIRVVINGESWGIYVNIQQFNKDFLNENFGTRKGTRWKVPGSPGGDGGLRYFGEDLAPYKERFRIKPTDNDHAWEDLIELCRTLEQTPADQLVAALKPILDIDSALWFLALDVSLVNSDGYWTRASDYSIYQDVNGRFHLIPHDMNEAFHAGSHHGPPRRPGRRGRREGQEDREGPDGPSNGPPFGPPPEGFDGPPGFGPPGGFSGPGGFGGPPPGFGHPPGGGDGVKLDPLIGLDNERGPLRSKLLAVPELKTRYLKFVRAIAQHSLDWQIAAPQIAAYRELLKEDVQADTRKLSNFEDFLKVTDPRKSSTEGLRSFFEKRREYLLNETQQVQD